MLLGGHTIDKVRGVGRARAGIIRSFQNLELFDHLTVEENIRTACEPRDRLSYLRDLVFPRKHRSDRLPTQSSRNSVWPLTLTGSRRTCISHNAACSPLRALSPRNRPFSSSTSPQPGWTRLAAPSWVR